MKNSKYIWFLVGAILLFVSNGKWMIPLSIWISLICLLRFSRLSKPWIGFISILVISFISNIFIWEGLIPLPSPLYYIVSLISAVFFSVPFLIERILIKKVPGYLQILIYPALFTFISFLYTLISPSGTYGSVAYSQNNLILLQIVSVTGIWGIIFVLGWTASTINFLLDNYKTRQKAYYSIGVYSFIVGIIVIFGLFRFSVLEDKSRFIKAAGIINDHNFNKSIKDNLEEFIESSAKNADSLFARTKECITNGAVIIFWQEAAHIVLDSQEDSLISKAKLCAQENNVYLGISIFSLSIDYPSKPAENKIIWLTPEGKTGIEYLKAFPTPAERIVQGKSEPEIMVTRYGNISSAICFDMNFPDYIRKYGQKNTGLLCVPANDWQAITPYHANISSFRGIENGFSIVRVAGNGLSAAFHSDGSMISNLNYFNSSERIFYTDIRINKRATFYTYAGNFLPWLCLLAIVIIMPITFTRKKHK